MNIIKRFLSILLVLCMMISVVPITALAAETAGNDDTPYRILHLDCGRKYFSKEWIIALITEMAAAGYTHLQLAFGNDGLRFLLDDMSVGTYSDDAVTAAIQAGNKAYYNAGTANELTQDEMDEIILAANNAGIGIIPLLNSPGHMDTMITALKQLGFNSPEYSYSTGTVDIADTTAMAFVEEFVKNYMDYFAAKGCKQFNIGTDEYANDISGGTPQFSSLIYGNLYDDFIAYINRLSEYALANGMTPMAFNDGIYYNSQTSYGTINENLMVCYWSNGWSGYDVAPAAFLAERFRMINTHGDWYYVLKDNGIQHPGKTNTTYPANFSETTFMGNATISNPAGSMFCIWCDVPGTATETEVAEDVRILLRQMVAAMNGEANNYSTEVVPGGFNEDGTVNDSVPRTWVTVTASNNSNISVSGFDLTDATATEVATLPEIAKAEQVKAWNILPTVSGVAYTDKGSVKLPVPTDWDTSRLIGFYVENGTAVIVSGTYANGYYSFDVPHFSVVGIAEMAEESYANEVAVSLKVNETATFTDNTGNYNIGSGLNATIAKVVVEGHEATEETVSTTKATEVEAGETYIIRVYGTSYALTSNQGGTKWGGSDGWPRAFEYYNTHEVDNMWTLEASGTGYKLKCADGYLNLGKNAAWIDATGEVFSITYSDSGWKISDGQYNIDALGGLYAYYCAGGWENSGTRFDLYKVLSSTDASTTITITGAYPGTTSVVVGDTKYNITVAYNEKTLNIPVNSSKRDTQSATISGDPSYSVAGLVTATTSGNTVNFSAGSTIGTTIVTVGDTRYTINVIEVPEESYTYEQDVNLTINESVTITDSTGNYEDTYTGAGLDENIATVQVKGTTAAGGSTENIVNSLTAGDTFYIKTSDGRYLTTSASTSNSAAVEFTSAIDEAMLWTVYYGGGTLGSIKDSYGYFLTVDNGIASMYKWERYVSLYDNLLSGMGTSTTIGTPVKIDATAPIDATDITITGVYPGTTSVVVGDTKYNITVSYKEKALTITANSSKSDTQSSAIFTLPTYSKEGVVTATVDGNTVTFTAGSVLDTTVVTVGDTIYTITVVELDLDSIAPLKLEYWITNGPVNDSATNLTYLEISAAQSGIYSVQGVEVSKLVPATLQRSERAIEYWRSVVLDVTSANDSTSGTQEQTKYSGDDETTHGMPFTHIRYWNDSWQVLIDTTWTNVNRTEVNVTTYAENAVLGTATRETNQLVAYYMEIIDIANENVDMELHINAADWGFKDGQSWGYGVNANETCTLTFQVVYEDNTTNPTMELSALASKTLIYGYWENGRGLGTVIFNGEGKYQIYKVTAETGDASCYSTGSGVAINDLSWDDNEEVIWSGAPTDSVAIGNPARVPSFEEPLDNIAWHKTNYNQNNAILVRIYVSAVATEDMLTVHYMDANANNLEFYRYGIDVNEGVLFNANIGMGSAKNTLVNNTVLNHNGITQAVSADLASMPQIEAYYRYCTYDLIKVERSADGKAVYLYYEFSPIISFVTDFGLPLQITPNDLNPSGYGTTDIKGVYVIGPNDAQTGTTAHATYGTLSVSGNNVIYTPTQILQGIDYFTIYIVTQLDNDNTTVNDEAGIAYRVYIYPATTVYYEESFLTTDAKWSTGGTAVNDYQTTEELDSHKNVYGYDPAYDTTNTGSFITSNSAGLASFTFTGTGFELYANSNEASGYVTVLSQGNLSKLYMINTVLSTGDTNATNQQGGGTYYGLPIISETELPYGEYTVQIKQTKGNAPIYIDGVRIINTLQDSTTFTPDEEDNPVFYELRDYVLNAIEVEKLNESDYIDSNDRSGKVDAVKDMAGQVYNALGDGTKAVIINNDTTFTQDQAQDLLDNGPKNELYLYKGQTLSFSVSTNRVMQLGLKSPISSAKFTLTVNDETLSLNSISSPVDMFYKIASKSTSDPTRNVTVMLTVNEGLLSVTKLKVCDDPNFTFTSLTEADITNVLLHLNGLGDEVIPDENTPEEPEIPDVIYADAYLNVTVKSTYFKETKTITLTANGVTGESYIFTANEILAALKEKLNKTYISIGDSALANTEVKFGATKNLELQEYLDILPSNNLNIYSVIWQDLWNQMENRNFTITAKTSEGGSISYAGNKNVKFNETVTYTITPEEGYEICSVVVDGKDVGAISTYTFKLVRDDHTISVTFCKEDDHNQSSVIIPDTSDNTDSQENTNTQNSIMKAFTDVNYDSFGASEIGILSGIGVIKGTTETEFSPEQPVTREQMAALLYRLMLNKDNTDRVNTTKFQDLYEPYYNGVISWANASGYIRGTSAETFEPTGGITLQDAMTMLIRALGQETEDMNNNYPVSYINTGVALGLDKGLEDLGYTETLNRAQIAVLLYNALTCDSYLNKNTALTESTSILEEVFGYSIAEGILVATDSYAIMDHAITTSGYVTLLCTNDTGADFLMTVSFADMHLTGDAIECIGKSFSVIYQEQNGSYILLSSIEMTK